MKVWLTLLLAFTLHPPAFALSINGFNLDNRLVPAGSFAVDRHRTASRPWTIPTLKRQTRP